MVTDFFFKTKTKKNLPPETDLYPKLIVPFLLRFFQTNMRLEVPFKMHQRDNLDTDFSKFILAPLNCLLPELFHVVVLSVF